MNSYFEGWYFKHQKAEETLSIIAGRAQDGAFLQVITPVGAHRIRYSPAEYHKGENTLQLAENYFDRRGIRLAIQEKDLEMTGRIDYSGLTPIDGDIMGPFQFLPMQCRHTVLSMNHSLRGKITCNGRELDFTGGSGYIEGDCGRSFPKSYTWVQCNAFSRPCSIMASAAHIPFGLSWFWGCICVVWLDGAEYRLATYKGAKIRQRDETQLLLQQRDLSLYVRFLRPHCGHTLDAPIKGKMTGRIRETPSAPAYFELRRHGTILFQGESPFASYEHVTEYTPHKQMQ